jgi:hypothetical protein
MTMMADQFFHHSKTPVSVIAVGDTGEALLVRSILESLGAVVTLHLIGTPEDFLSVIGQGSAAAPYIILCAHGDEHGLIFGEFDAGIDASTLKEGSMPPEVIAKRISLPGKVFLSTACGTGSAAFGDAFLKGGVAVYIAPEGYPDGADAALFVHILFQQIFCREMPVRSAVVTAQNYDEEYAMFKIFEGY